ncbi:MAG: NADH-quinone oxidoreductase subunit C, partial [Spirochaetaceae bacterium]
GYRHLAFFTAIDYIEEGTFRLVYMLHNYGLRHDLGVMVDIDRQGEGCRMESIHHLWPAAETYQRELREMFGIDFPGSPRLEEDFALEGWDGTPPMRREFDTRAYSEETYYARPGRHTHDTRAHMKEKLYPSEAETW